jgi:hypothetical protein
VKKNELITMSLANAKDWKQKGQPIWVVRCLSNAIVNRISIALVNGESRESTLKMLFEDGFADDLAWYCEELTAVQAGIKSKKIPGSAIGGNYLALVLHHFARLLGRKGEEEILLAVATCSHSLTISTRLWQEYAAGLQAIAACERFSPKKFTKLKGQEPYWLPYLHLEACISNGTGVADAGRLVDDAFRNRNSDVTITDDQYEIEGSGSLPIRWDYRKECILSYR